jgi:hypothetical protein
MSVPLMGHVARILRRENRGTGAGLLLIRCGCGA